MSQALVLVDLQQDFIRRPGLAPPIESIQQALVALLQHARSTGVHVVHVQTEVTLSPDNRMPHWQRNDTRECVAGSEGAAVPPPFAALDGEPIFTKQFFSGFGNPGLDAELRALGVEELWVTGLYTHSCVRATAMDAYERGYRVTLVRDCLGSNDALHAGITLQYLDGRAARLVGSAELMGRQSPAITHDCPASPGAPAVVVKPTPGTAIASMAADAALAARRWASTPLRGRREVIARFSRALQDNQDELLQLMVRDIGKPAGAATDELARARGHVDEACELEEELQLATDAGVRFEPHGAVALITPWNNPVAIAAGKIAAALVLGNSVVWKPAAQAANISACVLNLLHTSGVPTDTVQLVQGGPDEVATLAADAHIAAVSLTGPEQAGMAVAAQCLPRGKPLQAELGGNNALLVMEDADIDGLAATWALLAFSCAGQRCTAVRRFVVMANVQERFERAMSAAVEGLRVLAPETPGCQVGPMISRTARDRADAMVQQALERGARVVCHGASDDGKETCYLAPVLLAGLADDDSLVQEESFAPIAIVQVVDSFEAGVQRVNGVRQGLLAGIATASGQCYERFARECIAGIVIDGRGLPLHPGAPFGGRKASQIGPPEHGVWDREFFARPKALYRNP